MLFRNGADNDNAKFQLVVCGREAELSGSHYISPLTWLTVEPP